MMFVSVAVGEQRHHPDPGRESRAQRRTARRNPSANDASSLNLVVVAAVVVIVATTTGSSPSSPSTNTDDKQANVTVHPALKDGTLCDTVKQDTRYITLPNNIDGCSSLRAMLAEKGPFVVQEDLSTKLNPYSWTTNANVLWLDQPVFTGFSYGNGSADADSSGVDIRENLYLFSLKATPLATTSCRAGTCTSLARVTLATTYLKQPPRFERRTMSSRGASNKINLRDTAIGNELTAGAIQYAPYLDMANNSYGIKLASNEPALEHGRAAQMEHCDELINECNSNKDPDMCIQAVGFCTFVEQSGS